jgi:hypothetical protein
MNSFFHHQCLDICRFLVASKANVNACVHHQEDRFDVGDRDKNTPLHESSSFGVSQFLLECKAEVDAANSQ